MDWCAFFKGLLIGQDELAFDLMYLLRHGSKDVVQKLILKHRGTGLGSQAIRVETGNEVLEQIYVHLNTPAMDDFTIFEFIGDLLTGAAQL